MDIFGFIFGIMEAIQGAFFWVLTLGGLLAPQGEAACKVLESCVF